MEHELFRCRALRWIGLKNNLRIQLRLKEPLDISGHLLCKILSSDVQAEIGRMETQQMIPSLVRPPFDPGNYSSYGVMRRRKPRKVSRCSTRAHYLSECRRYVSYSATQEEEFGYYLSASRTEGYREHTLLNSHVSWSACGGTLPMTSCGVMTVVHIR